MSFDSCLNLSIEDHTKKITTLTEFPGTLELIIINSSKSNSKVLS